MTANGRSALVVLVTAVAAAVSLDSLLLLVSPVPRLREASDGIRQLEEQNPETVLIGSSHARTFHDLGQLLPGDGPGRPSLVAIPLEYGKLTGYAWLMDHRVFPLLDERAGDRGVRRARVRRVIVLTEWWDSCGLRQGDDDGNIPSRVWTLADYAADVRRNGFTSYNRNFVRERVRHWFGWSPIVQRRGTGRVLRDVGRAIAPHRTVDRHATEVEQWQRMLEEGAECIGDREQMLALERMLDGITARGLEAVVILFPRNPVTFTPKAIASTLAPFANLARSVAGPRGVRVIDLTTSSPLTGSDFADDFDHVTPAGNQRFAHWVLAHDLAFLRESSRPEARGPVGHLGATTAP